MFFQQIFQKGRWGPTTGTYVPKTGGLPRALTLRISCSGFLASNFLKDLTELSGTPYFIHAQGVPNWMACFAILALSALEYFLYFFLWFAFLSSITFWTSMSAILWLLSFPLLVFEFVRSHDKRLIFGRGILFFDSQITALISPTTERKDVWTRGQRTQWINSRELSLNLANIIFRESKIWDFRDYNISRISPKLAKIAKYSSTRNLPGVQ